MPGLAIVSQRAAFLREAHWGADCAIEALELPSAFAPLFLPFLRLPPPVAVTVRRLAPQPCRTSLPVGLRAERDLLCSPRRSFTRLGSVRAGPPWNEVTESWTFRAFDD